MEENRTRNENMIEGRNVVLEALRSGRPVDRLFVLDVSPRKVSSADNSPQVMGILDSVQQDQEWVFPFLFRKAQHIFYFRIFISRRTRGTESAAL